MRRTLLLTALLIPHMNTALAQTAADNARILQQRDQVQRDIANTDIGAGYAQMLNLFIEPSISASRLETDDADYDIFKLPLQYEFVNDEQSWDVVLRATLSHASATNTFSLIRLQPGSIG